MVGEPRFVVFLDAADDSVQKRISPLVIWYNLSLIH